MDVDRYNNQADNCRDGGNQKEEGGVPVEGSPSSHLEGGWTKANPDEHNKE